MLYLVSKLYGIDIIETTCFALCDQVISFDHIPMFISLYLIPSKHDRLKCHVWVKSQLFRTPCSIWIREMLSMAYALNLQMENDVINCIAFIVESLFCQGENWIQGLQDIIGIQFWTQFKLIMAIGTFANSEILLSKNHLSSNSQKHY